MPTTTRPSRKKPTRRKKTSSPRKRAKTRVERDSMGEMTVPSHVLYGATTQRAVLNFPVSGTPVPPAVIQAFGQLKRACAETNKELKLLDRQDVINVKGGAIALGHPLGCSGARITGALAHIINEKDAQFGLATMCIGMGQGVTTVIERV